MVDGSIMVGFPIVIADSERDMTGIEPGPLGWHSSALTNELQELWQKLALKLWGVSNYCFYVASDQQNQPNLLSYICKPTF